jgi:solute carrier family 50 (sugar transporter)
LIITFCLLFASSLFFFLVSLLHYCFGGWVYIPVLVIKIAPVSDLRRALHRGSLGTLNPFPWVMMTGNTLGWVVYGYYTHDPFVLASNLPGLILSLWLNTAAAKLQYLSQHTRASSSFSTMVVASGRHSPQHHVGFGDNGDNGRRHQHRQMINQPPYCDTNGIADGVWRDASPILPEGDSPIPAEEEQQQHDVDHHPLDAMEDNMNLEGLVLVPQERALFTILILWASVITYVGWILPLGTRDHSVYTTNHIAAHIVGIIVNVNLVFFYGAPLQAVQKVISTADSSPIHVPTMVMSWVNALFWVAYGFAKLDPIIVVPNSLGFVLGGLQGILCAFYPRKQSVGYNQATSNPSHGIAAIEDNSGRLD